MRCNSDCRFLTSVNTKGRCYCKIRGFDIKEIDPKILEDCNKFIDRFYIRHDILSAKY